MQSIPRIVVLGGYGEAGLPIARHLLESTNAEVVLVGRSLDKAAEAANSLKKQYAEARIHAGQADAAQTNSLIDVFSDARLAVVASSTAQYAANVIDACLKTSTDCIDIQYSSAKLAALENARQSAQEQSVCFITDAGYHPGLPGAVVHYAASKLDELESAQVGCLLSIDWGAYDLGSDTVKEFAIELAGYDPSFFTDGRWRKASWVSLSSMRKFDFGVDVGTQQAFPMFFEELRDLPDMYPTLEECGFYMAGTNWFSDLIVMPVIMLAMKIAPRKLAGVSGRALFAAWKWASKPPYIVVLSVVAEGLLNGTPVVHKLQLSHADGYEFTAIPTVACIRQLLDGDIGKPGVHYMAHIVDPERLMTDMVEMGVEMKESTQAEKIHV
jgi:saccharopine dehydrogenase (NAD+, L-lysine-forming)